MKSFRYTFVISILFYVNFLYADDNTSLGFDHSRKSAIKIASKSNAVVNNKYTALLENIKNSHFPGDDEHIAATAKYLIADQQRWLDYRATHCQLQSNVYVYPANSRMWVSNYNSCLSDMNKSRIKFLDDIGHEYKK